MRGPLRSQVLATTKIRSTRISVLGTVFHQLVEPGVYRGAILRRDSEVAGLSITVDSKYPTDQLDIDVADYRSSFGANHRELSMQLRPGGHLVFHASSGPADAYVLLGKAAVESEEPRETVEFDSRRLSPKDMFAVTLLRPGVYSIADEIGHGRGTVRVSYPTITDAPASIEPVLLMVKSGSIDPAELTIRPASPLIFRIAKGETAIAIQLESHDNGPKRKEDERRARRLVRWKRQTSRSGEAQPVDPEAALPNRRSRSRH